MCAETARTAEPGTGTIPAEAEFARIARLPRRLFAKSERRWRADLRIPGWDVSIGRDGGFCDAMAVAEQ
jgi:hypothetical protein